MFKKLREPVSALTHFVGIILSIVGLVVLILESVSPPKPWHIVAFSIFGGAMFLVYTASTLYHWLSVSPKVINLLRKFDQAMIYLLIAATYTPVCLIPLRGYWGWSVLGIIWGLALFGILMRLFWNDFPNWFSITTYLFMGWTIVVASWPLVKALEVGAIVWIVIGGLFYTVGAVIHALEKPNPIPKIFGSHEIFHIFVMLGSFSHFWVMYQYITSFN